MHDKPGWFDRICRYRIVLREARIYEAKGNATTRDPEADKVMVEWRLPFVPFLWIKCKGIGDDCSQFIRTFTDVEDAKGWILVKKGYCFQYNQETVLLTDADIQGSDR